MTINAAQDIRTAVLLAAGRGKRLKPHTDTVPKPLLIHEGKPTLDYLMDSLQLAGIMDVVIVTHHLSEQIDGYASERQSQSGQTIRCVRQHQLLGTADALEAVIDQCPDLEKKSFILSATDYLLPASFFPDLVDFHHENGQALSVSMKKLPEIELAGRSSVRFNEDESIAEIVEKPKPGTAPSSIGANLTFVLPADVIPYVASVPKSERGEREIQFAINQWIANGGYAKGLVQATPEEWQPPN